MIERFFRGQLGGGSWRAISAARRFPEFLYPTCADFFADSCSEAANKILFFDDGGPGHRGGPGLGNSFKRVLALSRLLLAAAADLSKALRELDLRKVFDHLGGMVSLLKTPISRLSA